ncbi:MULTISPECIES: cysteine--tRNA ligase [unclassified Caulobacter]|uniref:cysteine--tRNA ligase n=1 Tax=unclassified Caulobacter TaxID=2648921 RepID=UPI000D347DC6|nr:MULTISPECIES: cysteine--tRNA ligase [unclassified Caulobacter]PTS86588.1 cysteine--tRNA ligase [Caulobacter sp. HMWF009]PTT12738.1 cysteine--tRNA ligase [Caulobacter sp. HMWF025]
MTLKLYDTLAREKRAFVPADPERVTMYVCGPTVYNFAHIGNFRPVVAFDVLFRVLRHIYGEDAVVYARNVTDVDDKINKKAFDEGVAIKVITDRYLAAYHEDADALLALRPTLEPKATDHIGAIVEMIGKLVDNGKAYAAEGHVLFDTQAFPDYGQLSGRNMDDMIAGARVEVAPYKRHPADFVLWKPSKENEPEWDSPWGAGRPGWHIECSAMIDKTLGQTIDIHAGGIDLAFPHHENEVAQSRCAHDTPVLANYWMHNGFLDMSGEKMSKSLGNVVLPHELLKTTPGEVIRWALLSAHYRQPLDWTPELLEQSRKALDRLYGALRRAKDVPVDQAMEAPEEVVAALEDDLNTPQAISCFFEVSSAIERAVTAGDTPGIAANKARLIEAGALLGLLQADPDSWFEGDASDDLKAQVEALLTRRVEARAAKDWTAADAIRAELDALGVVVMDGPAGATWRMKD